MSNNVRLLSPLFLNPQKQLASDPVIVVGDGHTGKSHVVYCFCKERFPKNIMPTITLEFNSLMVELDPITTAKVQVWDTVGQQNLSSLTINQYRHSHGAMLVFDVASRRSFKHLSQWHTAVTQRAQSNVQIGILGHKCDQLKRQVSRQQGFQYAAKIGAFYSQTTVKDPNTIKKAFHKLIKRKWIGHSEIIQARNSEAMVIKLSKKQILRQDSQEGCFC